MDDKISRLMNSAVETKTFPGGVVGYVDQAQAFVLAFGRLTYDAAAPAVSKDTVYDIASLTKVIPTNSIILKLIEEGKLSPEDRAVKYLPEIKNPGGSKILIKHLMTYTVSLDIERLTEYALLGHGALLEALYTSPLKHPPGVKHYYTNAPAILLGLIAERIEDRALDKIAEEMFFKPLGMAHTTFHPDRLVGSEIAPTEVGEAGEIRGVVHDDPARVLREGGVVGGNAGVFSTAGDLLIFAQMLLNKGTYESKRYFKPATIALMHTNHIGHTGGSAGLGWDVGQEFFMGSKASAQAFGKTGFTGTSILVDPIKNKVVVLLSNRTYPQRPESSEAINLVRRGLADIVLG